MNMLRSIDLILLNLLTFLLSYLVNSPHLTYFIALWGRLLREIVLI